MFTSRWRNAYGFLLILAFVLVLWLASAVADALAFPRGKVTITATTSPACHEPDEAWRVDYALTVAKGAQGQLTIVSATPRVKWSNGGIPVDPGETITTSVNVEAGTLTTQLVLVDSDGNTHASDVVARPAPCATPTPEPTATLEPTATPEPVITLTTCEGDALVTRVNGAITSITSPAAECLTPTPTAVPSGVITPPSTGSAGLLDRYRPERRQIHPMWGSGSYCYFICGWHW